MSLIWCFCGDLKNHLQFVLLLFIPSYLVLDNLPAAQATLVLRQREEQPSLVSRHGFIFRKEGKKLHKHMAWVATALNLEETDNLSVLSRLLKRFHTKEGHNPTLNCKKVIWRVPFILGSQRAKWMEMKYSTPRHDPRGGTVNMVRLNNKLRLDHRVAYLKSLQLQENHPAPWSSKATEQTCNLRPQATALV